MLADKPRRCPSPAVPPLPTMLAVTRRYLLTWLGTMLDVNSVPCHCIMVTGAALSDLFGVLGHNERQVGKGPLQPLYIWLGSPFDRHATMLLSTAVR
jgi:hypothetical protein